MTYRQWLCLIILAVGLAPAKVHGAGAAAAYFNAASAEAVLKRHVLSHSQWPAEDFDLKVAHFPPVRLPAGRFGYRVLHTTRGVTPGPTSFLLALDVGGKEHTRLWVKAEIRVFEEVVVASVPLANREVLKVSDLRLERREISALKGRPFKDIEEVAGQRAIRGIEINEVVTQRSVEPPVLFKRGAAVTLVYETPVLRVESPGLAVEGGKAGETIQVKNPQSGKVLRGVVVDGRTVRIP